MNEQNIQHFDHTPIKAKFKHTHIYMELNAKEKNKAGGGWPGRSSLRRSLFEQKLEGGEGGVMWLPEGEHSRQREQPVQRP